MEMNLLKNIYMIDHCYTGSRGTIRAIQTELSLDRVKEIFVGTYFLFEDILEQKCEQVGRQSYHDIPIDMLTAFITLSFDIDFFYDDALMYSYFDNNYRENMFENNLSFIKGIVDTFGRNYTAIDLYELREANVGKEKHDKLIETLKSYPSFKRLKENMLLYVDLLMMVEVEKPSAKSPDGSQ